MVREGMSRNRFDYWYSKICDPEIVREARETVLYLDSEPLSWEVVYELLAYRRFSEGALSMESIIYLSRERGPLLDRLWPGDFPSREEVEAFYIATHNVLPWGHGVFMPDHMTEKRRAVWLRRVDVLNQLRRLGAKSVLDYGAGGGHTSLTALAMGFSKVGHHEYSVWHPYVRWRAERAMPERFAAMEFSPAEAPCAVSEHYDAVVCSDVAEHVYDPLELLETLTSIIRPGGLLAWVSLFGEGISCHLNPQYKGREEDLLSSFGFRREENLAADYYGFTGVFRFEPPARRPRLPETELPEGNVVRIGENAFRTGGKENGRKRVAFIYDMKGWAWWHRGRNIRKHLTGDYVVDVVSQDEPFDAADYDFIVVFESRMLERLPAIPAHNLVLGCSAPHNLDQALKIYETSGSYSGFIVNNRMMFEKAGHARNVFCCPNGVDEQAFYPAPGKPRRFTACWVGNTDSVGKKGLELVKEACVKADVPLVFYDRQQAPRLLSHAELRDSLYHRASVYINASVTEGTPNPALEAMACGLPVISTRTGNMPELIVDGENGCLVERSADAIADALRRFRAMDQEALTAKARAAILDGWRWADQAENYRAMFDTLYAKRAEGISSAVSAVGSVSDAVPGAAPVPGDEKDGELFEGRRHVYLANADIMAKTLSNEAVLRQRCRGPVHRYATVVGGLSGLNYIAALRPESLVFFDVNSEMVRYSRFLVEMIGASRSPADFLTNMFGRSVERFEAETGAPLTVENQDAFLARSVERGILDRLDGMLGEESREIFREYVEPHLFGSLPDGPMNCRRLLPCWPVAERVPVGAGSDTGYNEAGVRVPNVNTFFYGHGWLASQESFDALKRSLEAASIEYRVADLLSGDLAGLAVPGRSNVLHASNVDDWFRDRWDAIVGRWQADCRRDMTDLMLVTSHNGVFEIHNDPHCKAYEAVLPFVRGSVIELTHKPDWGFHEFSPRTVVFGDYLSEGYDTDTIILHIPLANGIGLETFVHALDKGIRESRRLILLEHNQASADWKGAMNVPSKEKIASLVGSVAKTNQAGIRECFDVAGFADDKRNFVIVVE